MSFKFVGAGFKKKNSCSALKNKILFFSSLYQVYNNIFWIYNRFSNQHNTKLVRKIWKWKNESEIKFIHNVKIRINATPYASMHGCVTIMLYFIYSTEAMVKIMLGIFSSSKLKWKKKRERKNTECIVASEI